MKTVRLKSVVPVYITAAAFALFGLVFPLYTLRNILFAAVVSMAAYWIGQKFFPGKTIEVESALDAGDKEINRQLRESQEALKQLRDSNAAIPSESISSNLDRMDAAGTKILQAVAEKPERASQVRKFMNYYLPTSAKLLDRYRSLGTVGGGENVQSAKKRVEESLDLVAFAFEKQLDNLYKDEALDISTDVKVLETMMAADGLTDANANNLLKGDH